MSSYFCALQCCRSNKYDWELAHPEQQMYWGPPSEFQGKPSRNATQHQAKPFCTWCCVHFPFCCTKQTMSSKWCVSEQRRSWAPPGPHGTPAADSSCPVLDQIPLVGCCLQRWAALPAGGLEDQWNVRRGKEGSSLGVWEKHSRNSAMFLLKWSGEANYLVIQIALLANPVNLRGI